MSQRGKRTVYPQTLQSYLQQMSSTRSKAEANLTNLTDDSERIGKKKPRSKISNMRDTGAPQETGENN